MIGASKSLVTLKDHKGNFMNHHTTSLVNPSKNEIERISEHILDQINTFTEEILNEKLHFLCIVKNINDKRLYKFLQININDFYPSIKETLLHEDIKLAKEHLPITRKDIEIIFHVQKSVSYNEGVPWVKKKGDSFDVTMGACDGAEVCNLIVEIYWPYSKM